MPKNTATVCLCMIVKNEFDVLANCLQSVKPLIDYWIIADTGSTDGTQDLITKVMMGTPGELHERPWRNFGANRTETIELAGDRSDYLLFIDADETLVRDDGFAWPELRADAYQLIKQRGTRRYRIPALVKAAHRWRFVGVLHEHLKPSSPVSYEPLDGIVIDSNQQGARSRDPHTYRRDALLLEAGLLDEPDNERYVFYLAQSYRDCEDYDLAIRNYERRVAMGGWSEEVFIALYQTAHCRLWRKESWSDVLAAYLKAYAFRPTRAEPLYAIGKNLVQQKDYTTALIFLKRAQELEFPDEDILFVEANIYHFHIDIQIGVCYYYLRDYERAKQINKILLNSRAMPPRVRQQVEANLKFTLKAIGEMVE